MKEHERLKSRLGDSESNSQDEKFNSINGLGKREHSK